LWVSLFLGYLKSGAFAWLLENATFLGSAANLVVQGNISLTINIALSERVTGFSAVVRHSKDIKTNSDIGGKQYT